MSFDQMILWVVAVGAIVGGADKLLGNKFGLGEKFDDGFQAMGALAASVAGVVVLAPVLADLLAPVLIPVFGLVGADPAMFASLIANDMGGYSLAVSLAVNGQAGLMAGLITASMLGCTLVFSIPVGLGLIEEEDRPYFAQGLLLGLITVPIGSIVGGLAAGFDSGMVLRNNIPIAVFALLLALGLKFFPQAMTKGAIGFGKVITWIAIIGAVIGTFTYLTGITVLPNAAGIMDGLDIVCAVTVVLIGIFPALELIIRLLRRALGAVGNLMGIDAVSTGGLIFTLANSVPVYSLMKDMNKKGKIINVAWLVPATAALGDHLGFTAGVDPSMITPMIIGKLSAGVCALVIALIYTSRLKEEAPTK